MYTIIFAYWDISYRKFVDDLLYQHFRVNREYKSMPRAAHFNYFNFKYSLFFIVSFSIETLCRLVYTRGSEWGDPLVGCRLKFSNFVGSRLKFSIFVGSRLNFSIFAGCRKISVNKYKRLLIIYIFYVFHPLFKTLIPKRRVNLARMHHLIAPKPFIKSCFLCNMNVYFIIVCH